MKDHHLQMSLEQMSSTDDRIFIQAFVTGFLPQEKAVELINDWQNIMSKYREHWRYDTVSAKVLKTF